MPLDEERERDFLAGGESSILDVVGAPTSDTDVGDGARDSKSRKSPSASM